MVGGGLDGSHGFCRDGQMQVGTAVLPASKRYSTPYKLHGTPQTIDPDGSATRRALPQPRDESYDSTFTIDKTDTINLHTSSTVSQRYGPMPAVSTFNNDNNINPLVTPGLYDFSGFLRFGVGDPLQAQLAVKFTF